MLHDVGGRGQTHHRRGLQTADLDGILTEQTVSAVV